MKLLEGEVLRRHILESYSKNPRDWSFTISPSLRHGFYDALVSGPEGAWMLKIDSIFKPFPLMLGSQTEADSRLKPGPFPYGYRKLSPQLVLQMLGGEGSPRRDKTAADLLSVLGSEPVVPEEGGSYAHGPFVFTSPGRAGLPDGQSELDEKLNSEMRRLLMARYPGYG